MSEREAFLKILDRAGVAHEVTTQTSADGEVMTEVEVENTDGVGYFGFMSTWTFDCEGNLTTVGHYE